MTLPPVYPIIDGPLLTARGLRLSLAAEALLEAGMRLVQFRWKGGHTREVYAEARRIADLCRDALLIVNDRIDVAMLLGGGVHLGQEDIPAADARKLLGAEAVIGLSTHSEAQFNAACREPVDYIAIGPIFATASKANPDPVVGLAGPGFGLPCASARPVVAIGGITRGNAPAVWRAGAASVAVIGDMYPPESTKASIRARAEEWMRIAHEHRG